MYGSKKQGSEEGREGGKMEVRKERMEVDGREGSKEVGRKPNKDCLRAEDPKHR